MTHWLPSFGDPNCLKTYFFGGPRGIFAIRMPIETCDGGRCYCCWGLWLHRSLGHRQHRQWLLWHVSRDHTGTDCWDTSAGTTWAPTAGKRQQWPQSFSGPLSVSSSCFPAWAFHICLACHPFWGTRRLLGPFLASSTCQGFFYRAC